MKRREGLRAVVGWLLVILIVVFWSGCARQDNGDRASAPRANGGGEKVANRENGDAAPPRGGNPDGDFPSATPRQPIPPPRTTPDPVLAQLARTQQDKQRLQEKVRELEAQLLAPPASGPGAPLSSRFAPQVPKRDGDFSKPPAAPQSLTDQRPAEPRAPAIAGYLERTAPRMAAEAAYPARSFAEPRAAAMSAAPDRYGDSLPLAIPSGVKSLAPRSLGVAPEGGLPPEALVGEPPRDAGSAPDFTPIDTAPSASVAAPPAAVAPIEAPQRRDAPVDPASLEAMRKSAPASEADDGEQEFQRVQVFYATDRARASLEMDLKVFLLPGGLAVLGLLCYLAAFRAGSRSVSFVGHLAMFGALFLTGQVSVDWQRSRLASDSQERIGYSNERGVLEHGVCQVTIPQSHEVGVLESPSILRLEMRYDPLKHVTLESVAARESEEFFTELRQAVALADRPEVFVFVHGYNVKFDDAVRRTGQMAHDLDYQGVPICYSWPSQGGLLKYTVDETNVTWTVPHLKKFLLDAVQRSGARSVNLIAHSMGNRALTNCLRELHLELREESKLFNEVVLAAPDVDAEVFRRDLAPSIVETARRVTLYASSNDRALIASQRVHGYPRAGESGDNLIIVPGIDTIDVSTIDTSLLGHSYYGGSILSDLHLLFVRAAPITDRTWLLPQSRDGLTYFIYDRAGAGSLESPVPTAARTVTGPSLD